MLQNALTTTLFLMLTMNYVAQQRAVALLISKLGDRSFRVREAAASRLFTIGGPAVRQLEEAAKVGPDAETRERCRALVEHIFVDYIGDERLLPGPDHLSLREFVTYVPRYEPQAQAKEDRVCAPGQAGHLWEGGYVAHRVMREYLREFVRKGASRREIKEKIAALRHNIHRLHLPFTNYPEYAELRKHLKEEPWYFFWELPKRQAPPARAGGKPMMH